MRSNSLKTRERVKDETVLIGIYVNLLGVITAESPYCQWMVAEQSLSPAVQGSAGHALLGSQNWTITPVEVITQGQWFTVLKS